MLTLWNDAAQLWAIDDGMVKKNQMLNIKKRLDKSEKRNDRWTQNKSDAFLQADRDFGLSHIGFRLSTLVDSNVTIMSLQFKQAQSN